MKDVVARLERDQRRRRHREPARRRRTAPSTVSKDGRSVVVNFTLPGKAETEDEIEALEKPADAPLAAVAAVQKAHPELLVRSTATRPSARRSARRSAPTRPSPTQFSMGGTLIILLLAFGAVVAAGVPLLLGISAVRRHHRPARPGQPARPLHEAVGQVTMLIGLAVGVDYAMFYMRRMMEERDKGRSSEAALDVAAATSGRAVLISGFTVIAAMAGMFFSGNAIFSPSASARSSSSASP